MSYSFVTKPGTAATVSIPVPYNLSGTTLTVETSPNSDFQSTQTRGTVTYSNGALVVSFTSAQVDAMQDSYFRVKAVRPDSSFFYVVRGQADYTQNNTLDVNESLLDENGYIKHEYIEEDIFAPAVSRIVVGWPRMDSSAGSLASVGQFRAYTLADTGNPNVTSLVDFPTAWSTYNVKVLWVNATTNAGDVVMRYDYMVTKDGVLATATSGFKPQLTVAATTQFLIKETTLATAVPVDPSGPNMVKMFRFGGDAADTLVGNIAIVALVLTKVA